MSTLRTNAVESITGTATDFPNSLKIQGTLVPSGSAATEPTSRFPYVVGSVAELASVPEGLRVDGSRFDVTGWHSGGLIGGGSFSFNASKPKSLHNGGTIISPTVPPVSQQPGATLEARVKNFLSGEGETDGAGSGVFERQTVEVSAFVFGAKGDGVFVDTASFHAYRDAFPKSILVMLEGTYKGNFVINNNCRLLGAGQNKTKLIADDPSITIITFAESVAIDRYYLNAKGFWVDGQGTASRGVRIGFPDQSQQVSYGVYKDIEVSECVNNIEINRAIGCLMESVYSRTASESALLIPVNDIVTVATFVGCQFRQSKTNLELRGGAILNFRSCVIESAKDLGMLYQKATSSGARQTRFDSCWFENNGFEPVTTISGGVYIDMASTLADVNHPSGLSFVNTVISSADVQPDLRLNRGSQIEFDKCSFKNFEPDNFKISSTGYAYAHFKDCGTIDEAPSPTLYANFPDRTLSAGRYLGISYDYKFQGATFRNYTGKIARPSTNVSSYDVRGIVVLPVDTAAGNVDLTSLANGFDGQEISIIKPSGANNIVIPHNGAGSQPFFTPDATSKTLTGRQGARVVCEKGVWYFASA